MEEKQIKKEKFFEWNAPNIITIFRVLLIVAFLWLFIEKQYKWALAAYVVAFISDIADGAIARKMNMITNFGKLMDPVADKLMLFAVLISFCTVGWIDLWILLVMATKDLLMMIGGLFLYSKQIVVSADWFGKIATGAFALGIVLTAIGNIFYEYIPQINDWYINKIIIAMAVGASLIAFGHYAVAYLSGGKTAKEKTDENNNTAE